jgi:hypothetical protein
MRVLTGWFGVKIFGYLIFLWGALSTIVNVAAVKFYSFPFEMGISLGNGAIMLLGLVTIAVANCIKTLEARLQAIEARVPGQRN